MKWTVAKAKSRMGHLPSENLDRLYRRVWKWIEKQSGCGLWDYPTLYATWPMLACYLVAINELMAERREDATSQ